jgi:hypothetical protein
MESLAGNASFDNWDQSLSEEQEGASRSEAHGGKFNKNAVSTKQRFTYIHTQRSEQQREEEKDLFHVGSIMTGSCWMDLLLCRFT